MELQRSAGDGQHTAHVAPLGVAAWSGQQYLDFIQLAAAPNMVAEIWLGHQRSTSDTSQLVLVGTFTNERLRGGPSGPDTAQLNARHEAIIKLVNISLPGSGVARPNGFGSRLIEFCDDVARDAAQWTDFVVDIDDRETSGQAIQFGGGKAVAVILSSGRGCVVVSYGLALGDIVIETVDDTEKYGFSVADLTAASMRHMPFAPFPETFHPDYRPILQA